MKFGSNYASLRIPFGDPLRIIQFRFGEFETSNSDEIKLLTNHPETYPIGGGVDGAGTSDGNKTTKPDRKSRNTGKRVDSSND